MQRNVFVIQNPTGLFKFLVLYIDNGKSSVSLQAKWWAEVCKMHKLYGMPENHRTLQDSI